MTRVPSVPPLIDLVGITGGVIGGMIGWVLIATLHIRELPVAMLLTGGGWVAGVVVAFVAAYAVAARRERRRG